MRVYFNSDQQLSPQAKREQESSLTLKKNVSRFKFDERARELMESSESVQEFQAKQEWEFELSATLILIWTGL